MKNLTIIFFICCLSNCLLAHNAHYEKVSLRQWNIEKEHKTVKGSFCMMKDGKIFIENDLHQVLSYPLNSLSEKDKNFALDKEKEIMRMNEQLNYQHRNISTINLFNYKLWVWAFVGLFVGLSLYSIKFISNTNIKYPIIFLSVLGVISLSAFNQKIARKIQILTNPATIDSAFAPFVPSVHTYNDSKYFYVESQGIPTTHQMMVGISNRGWQRQVPIPQCYIGTNAWPIPLNPVMTTNPIPVDSIHFTRGAIAVAVNGVPIFNVHTNTGVDSYLDGQLDSFGGHCGRADDYHYHTAPLHLYNYTKSTLPIAYALDGFAVYGNIEPDGSAMLPLDANHGHTGSNGIYHYHGTTNAPYMIAKMAGQVTEDATHQLIPQAAAKGVRPALTPLNGALITGCKSNATKNGYTVTYTINGLTDSIVYSWNTTGTYTFKFYTNGNLDSTKIYNGFAQCTVPKTPTEINELADNKTDISIYPNLTHDYLMIQMKKELQSEVKKIEIYNSQGKSVFRINNFQGNIDVKQLENGSYFLKVQLSNKQITKKFIVQ